MRNLILLIGATALSGCVVGPTYSGPPAASSAVDNSTRFRRATDPTLTDAPGLAHWWVGLGDPILNRLVDDALANSPTLDRAMARIREAQAQLRQQRSASLPSVSANGTYLHAELPGVAGGGQNGSDGGSSAGTGASDGGGTSLDFYNAGLNASWEADLFGGQHRGVEQRRALVAAREADLADAQVTLSAQVAQAYVGLRDVQERMRLNEQSTQLQARQISLTRLRVVQGTASRLDLKRLQTQLESTEADRIPLQAQSTEDLGQLAVLTGRRPGDLDDLLDTAVPVPLPPSVVPIGSPAALIANRPDVRAAERQLAASTAAIGVSKAKELPGIRFLGLLGLGGTKPGDVLDFDNLTALATPMLTWSLLDFGRAHAATRASEAQRDQADAGYRDTVLEALQDAETALSRFGNTRAQLAQLLRAEASSREAAALNLKRFQAGTSTLIDQLDVERSSLSSSIAVAQGKAQLSQSYIAVNKALGLGWEARGSDYVRQDSTSAPSGPPRSLPGLTPSLHRP